MKVLADKRKNHPAQPPPPPPPPEGSGGKAVVVAVRTDPQSKELLTWALVKAAVPGDRVIALHIVPSAAGDAVDADALVAVVQEFESVIAVYEGFCNLKQIDLKLKVFRGSSLRKLLVEETRSLAASALILGVSKNTHHAIGQSPTFIAKHCAKKLSGYCTVLAVNNGKVVFQREAAGSNKSAHWTLPKDPFKHHNYKAAGLNGSPAIRAQAGGSDDPEYGSKKWICSVCGPAIMPPRPSSSAEKPKEQPWESAEGRSLNLVSETKPESPSSSATTVIPGEARQSWLLRPNISLPDRKSTSKLERSKLSVIQWAMRLPGRHSSSLAVHPDPKQARTDASAAAKVEDEENKTIIPVRTDSISPFVASNDKDMKLLEQLKSVQEKYSSLCRLFSYEELVQATSCFSPDNLVGKGGSSLVYRGRLSDGKQLAVKILKPSDDGMQEFISEVKIITSLHHKNIISLIGLCFENGNLILVYDYLSRGSLEEILLGEENNKVLSWPERYKVAVDVAEALDYLHNGGGSQPVIHGDVKSSNILLADDFEPQLCDFGLARWAPSSSSSITCCDVTGTFGYLAPEYFMYGKVNEKIDVYAFGVVLLELLSGRKPVSSGSPKGQGSLVMWAKVILQGGKVKQLLDPSLGNKYDNDQMDRMVLAASLCIRRAAQSRPSMALVLKLLQGYDDILEWAKSEVGGSELDGWDETTRPDSNIQSYINLALLDMGDETASVSSKEFSVDFISSNTSLEEYLQGRCSRSSSYDLGQ